MSLESAFRNLIDKGTPGLLESALRGGLSVLAAGMNAATQTRLWMYRQHILRTWRLDKPVISVGNLTLGGSGKTPIVEMLAREMTQRGRRAAILTRGYKGKAESTKVPQRVEAGGAQPLREEAEKWGDEPLLLARRLPEAAVVVGKDRVRGGKIAIEELGADLLILDDGFQYLKLERDLNLLVVDGNVGFNNGKVFPRGMLRENLSGIRRASAILIKNGNDKRGGQLENQIRKMDPKVPLYYWEAAPQHWEELESAKQWPLVHLVGKPVLCLSGIANPESFETGCEKVGARVVERIRFPDHHYFTAEEIQAALKRAAQKKAEALVTTEKDAMRWPAHIAHPIPIYFLRIAARSPEFLKSQFLSHI